MGSPFDTIHMFDGKLYIPLHDVRFSMLHLLLFVRFSNPILIFAI